MTIRHRPPSVLAALRRDESARQDDDPTEIGFIPMLLLHSAFFILHSSMAAIEFISFAPVVMFNLILQIRQRILHGLNKIPTAGCHAA